MVRPVHLSLLFIALTLSVIPLGFIVASAFGNDDEVYQYVSTHLLGETLVNTGILMLGVSFLSVLLGVGLAALVTFIDFPGVRLFSWAFMLPLAFPTYVMAFIYIGLLDFTGPVQTQLREWFGDDVSAWFPEIRSTWGVILIFSLCLYPYVYFIAWQAFASLSMKLVQASRSLGVSLLRTFFSIVLPLSLPWIWSGMLLVTMETLADFGGVVAFNYASFTTLIYKAWFDLGSVDAAMKLSFWLCFPALALMFFGIWAKGRRRFGAYSKSRATGLIVVRGVASLPYVILSLLVLFFVFAIPLFQLIKWAFFSHRMAFEVFKWSDLWHSLAQSFFAGVIIVILGFVMAAMLRFARPLDRGLVSLSLLGYSIPGTILAVAMFRLFSWIDHALWLPLTQNTVFSGMGLLAGSLLALLVALASRYLAVGFNGIDSQLEQLNPRWTLASRSLGRGAFSTVMNIHLPLSLKAICVAFVMVFVDVMKEMPITLMTRPMGWDTLSVRVYEFTSEGDWENAALPALVLVVLGMLPLAFLKWFSKEAKVADA